MEHNGNDNDFLDNLNNPDEQGDFNALLKEKIKGWTEQNELEILDTQVEKPIPLQQTEKDKQETAESVAEDLKSNTSSQETQGQEVSSESSDVQDVEEVIPGSSEDIKRRHEPVTRPYVEHVVPPSDPEYSRQIIEGKIAQVKIRGIQQGPWAKPEQAIQALPHEEVLEKLGFSLVGSVWKNARNFYVRKCGNDIDKIVQHINRLEGAAFITRNMTDAGREYLNEMLVGLSESERKRAEELISKVYREKSERAHPGRKAKTTKDGNGEVKVPVRKGLKKDVKAGLDLMISLNATYEMLIDKVKAEAGPDMMLKVEYLKERFQK